jgi:hypothetical protein
LKRLLLAFYCIVWLCSSSFSRQTADTLQNCGLRITLLTCAPGEELYSTFGHTAIRVQDSLAGVDAVYNYGTFEFAPDFYSKFIRGKLLYSLSVEAFPDFLYTYQLESRSVVEQELQLSCAEKLKLYTALQINSLEENRHYKYDFLFDNCTTRARDIIANNTASPVNFNNILPANVPSFRNLIHSYLDKGHEPWSKLWIDIFLGAKLDRKVTNLQSMFLPDYLLKGLDSARVNGKHLVTAPSPVLTMPSPLDNSDIFTPLVCLSLLFLVVLFLSLKQSKRTARILLLFDFLFFFILGLAGLLLLFMWFGTDHTVTSNNYNLAWALPTHVVIAFFIGKRRSWVLSYFKAVFWLTIIFIITWFFLPQQLNLSLLPIALLIGWRSWNLAKNPLYGTERDHNKG